MSNYAAASIVKNALRANRTHPVRSIAIALTTLGLLASSAASSAAQTLPGQTSKWEFRASSGALVATGAQRNSLKDSQLSAAQISWVVRPSLAITGTFGWARSRDLASIDSPKLDVFTSDLGIEARPALWTVNRSVTFSPFVGVGAGMRSYNYRKLDVDATNNIAGYGAVGGEFGLSRIGLRLEVRDYATGFKPLVSAGKSDARNDVVLMAAIRFRKHHASNQE